MTKEEILSYLEEKGNEQTKKVYKKHGAKEPLFGVKVEDLKSLQKKIKKDHKLAMQLYNTGNSDAMYFAAMICDPSQMSMEDLDNWAEKAYWYYLSEHTVAPVAAEHPYGYEAALNWIKSDKENIASAGWATLSNIIVKKKAQKMDLRTIGELLGKIPSVIHGSPNRVRYTMNGFIIAAGGYIQEFTATCKSAAKKIGKVHVDMGGTACKVPDAVTYIDKVAARRK
jgi:3-methyladenine DNA glycosylase AlkD